jgi:hypothetical protein
MTADGAPKVPKQYRLSILDVATLLFHVHRGAQHPEVGFEDAERTIERLTRELFNKRVIVGRDQLQSALWSCNLLDEQKEFWSPHGEQFDKFVHRLLTTNMPLQPIYFDKTYNLIKIKS